MGIVDSYDTLAIAHFLVHWVDISHGE